MTVRASWPTSTIVPPKIRTKSPTSPRDLPWRAGSGAAHAEERQLAFDGLTRRHFGDLHHIHEFEQLLGQLLDRRLLQVHDDGDPTEGLVVAGRHRQRNYIETPAGEKGGNTSEHARPVLDDYGDGLVANAPATGHPGVARAGQGHPPGCPFSAGPQVRVEYDVAVGAGGRHQRTHFSRESVRKSTTTGRSSMALALSMTGPTSAWCSTRKATQPMASAHLT